MSGVMADLPRGVRRALVAGVLMLAGTVLVVLRWAEVKAWLDAPAVLDAETTVRDLDLPASFDDDATNSACDLAGSRCAWTALPPDEAVAQLAGALVDAELPVAEVTCAEAGLPVLAGLLPDRLAPVVDEPCWNEANGVCLGWHGVIDVMDLEPDVLPGLVAELVEAGFYLPRADLAGGGISVQAHRRLEPGSWTGAFVVVREVEGQVVADAFGR